MGTDQPFCALNQGKAEIAKSRKTRDTVTNACTRAALMEWLRARVAAVLEMPQDSIDIDRNLEDYGLDSLQAVGLTGDLQTWLGIDIPPTVIWDYASIGGACNFLVQLMAAAQSPAGEANGDQVDARRNT